MSDNDILSAVKNIIAENLGVTGASNIQALNDKTVLSAEGNKLRIDFSKISSDTALVDRCEEQIREYLSSNYSKFTENRVNSIAVSETRIIHHDYSVQNGLSGFQYVEEKYKPTNNRTDRPIILISVDPAAKNSLKIAS